MIHVIATVSAAILMMGGGPELDIPDTPEPEARLAKIAVEPPPPAPAPVQTTVTSGTPSYATWIKVAECESGYGGPPRWDLNTGNGFFGGLQFALSSWQWVGGQGYPHHASKDEQIYRANLLWQRQGWNGWPACSRKLGLR